MYLYLTCMITCRPFTLILDQTVTEYVCSSVLQSMILTAFNLAWMSMYFGQDLDNKFLLSNSRNFQRVPLTFFKLTFKCIPIKLWLLCLRMFIQSRLYLDSSYSSLHRHAVTDNFRLRLQDLFETLFQDYNLSTAAQFQQNLSSSHSELVMPLYHLFRTGQRLYCYK